MKTLLIGAGNSTELHITIGDETPDITTLDLSGADINHDLEVIPYPIGAESFEQIHAYEVLEHTGAQGDFRFFFDQWGEFHRILKPGGYFCGSVPRTDSVWAWGDPGHKRVLPPTVFNFLVESFYENVGKGPLADYRPWVKGWWEALPAQTTDDRFFFALQKA